MDGTLLTSQHTISPATLEVLLTLSERGILIGFASGRGYQSVQRLIKNFPIHLPMTVFNGSIVYEARTGEILLHLDLDQKIVEELIARTRGTSLHIHVTTETQVFLDIEDAPHYKKVDPFTYVDCKPLETLSQADYPVIKAMITGKETETAGRILLDELQKDYPGMFTAVSTFKDHIEIVNPKANKRAGVEMVASMYNIELDEIIAFGDAENDCEMLRAVGWGVAMANASEMLKGCADDITKSNDEDGIAHYLTALFDL